MAAVTGERSQAEIYPGIGMWETRETAVSITDFSGSMRNVQIKAPASRTPAEIKKGVIHNPLWTRSPKIIGETEAARLPAIFIIPETVPLYSPPTSMGTAQAGLITNSRKNSDAVKQSTAIHARPVMAAGIRQRPDTSIAGAATIRRANLSLPVLL
jgi:hypothetical protein